MKNPLKNKAVQTVALTAAGVIVAGFILHKAGRLPFVADASKGFDGNAQGSNPFTRLFS